MGFDWQKFIFGKRRFRLRLKVEESRMKCMPKLPSRFCQVCSLQEGSAVMVTLLQVSTLLVLVLSILTLTAGRRHMEEVWNENLARDLQAVFGNDSENYQQAYKDAWMIGAWTLIGVCSLYFLTGVGVLVAAAKPAAVHPAWCLPWLIVTAALLAGSLCLIVLIIVSIVILFFTRKVTITSDVVPPLLVAAFICFWVYAFIIVLAHWKKMKRTKVAAKLIASTLVPRNIPVSQGLHL